MSGKLKCKICGTEIKTPKCCNMSMNVKGDVLRCNSCGDKNEIPIHCGREMKAK